MAQRRKVEWAAERGFDKFSWLTIGILVITFGSAPNRSEGRGQMSELKGRLDQIRVMDKRICHGDGIWSGEYYYEWSCGCKIYIPVFKDGSLGAGHWDEYCREHSIEAVRQPESRRACHS
jgi:hypothetical protein